MKKSFLYYIILFSALFIVSCKPSIDDGPSLQPGSADFSKYIAVGNSLTSGYADGGLYLEGQQVAYPNLIAAQLKTVGGGEFTSPFFSEDQRNGSGYLSLQALVNGQPVLGNVTDQLAYRNQDATLLSKYTGGEIQNLGVPGMRVDLAFLPVFSAANMYFERLLPDDQVGSTIYANYIQGRGQTFFSFWLGNNDVLGYAMNGAVHNSQDPTTALTDQATFKSLYTEMLTGLMAGGAKGILATIPDVTSIPFFNTVTVGLLLQQAQAANPQAQAIFIATKDGVRAADAGDLIILPFLSAGLFGKPDPVTSAPYGLHPSNPIQDQYVLDKDEVADVKAAVTGFNNTITSLAQTNDLALADVYSYLNEVKGGVNINGVVISSAFITGGAFSLDGIHLTPRGNALIANLFINAINKKYGSGIPEVDITAYRGVKLPDQQAALQ